MRSDLMIAHRREVVLVIDNRAVAHIGYADETPR